MTQTGRVQLNNVKVVENNHVGQEGDWTYTAEVNSQMILVGEKKTITISDDNVKFSLKVCEKDKIQDIGVLNKTLKYSEIKNKTKTLKVHVTENRGRYAGNTATVAFEFELD